MDAQDLTQEQREQLLRQMLFVPCTTRAHLHAWVRAYLGIDLPSVTVCHDDTDFEPSNSNPMDLLWEIYQAARSNDREKSRFLYYAARGCYKSVIASIVEALCLFHLRRDVGHMAANKKQSKVVQEYLANYLQRPVLRDFMTSKNESEISVTWYENNGRILSPAEFEELRDDEPRSAGMYVEKKFQVTVVVATLGGANGIHCSMMIMDELDLTPAEIVSEAMMIPAPGKESGEPPMVLMTSSRKFSTGPVQNAIDNAHRTGMQVRHWNVIDVTRACPPRRYLPMAPRIEVHYSNETLETITADAYENLGDEERKAFKKDEAYQGCVTNCRIFAMCRGRLATEQTCDTNLLRHVEDTQELFISQPDVEKAQAQLMCWKPSRAGMIYPRLSRDRHVLTAGQIYAMMTGEEAPEKFGKKELISFLATQEVRWYAGLDHGYNHCTAGTLGFRFGAMMFVVDAFEVPGLELEGKIRLLEERWKKFNPVIYADTSHKADNKTIKRYGFQVRKWDKGAGSVVDGIGTVRMKLNPVIGDMPELFFLAGDPGVEQLFDRLIHYAWVIDRETGEPTDEPNEAGDDGPDAFRYMVMNVFGPKGHGVRQPKPEETNPLAAPRPEPPNPSQVQAQNWSMIMDHVGTPNAHLSTNGMKIEDPDEPVDKPRRKGSLVFDLG